MTDHLLLLSFDNRGYAMLKRRDGSTISVLREWLPKQAIKGSILIVTQEPGEQGSAVKFAIASGRVSRWT